MKKRIPIAIRGRNPVNPSDRTPGIPTVQRIEPQIENICNTLTTVNKDTMILEIVEDSKKPIRGGGRIKRLGALGGEHQGNLVFDSCGICRCLTATEYKHTTKIIRTGLKEC